MAEHWTVVLETVRKWPVGDPQSVAHCLKNGGHWFANWNAQGIIVQSKKGTPRVCMGCGCNEDSPEACHVLRERNAP